MKAPINHRLLLPLLLAIIIQCPSFSQIGNALLINSRVFKIEDYKDIEGTLYYFTEWQLGQVYPKDRTAKYDKVEEYLINYNGYSKSFEIRKDGQFIPLDKQYYDKIEIQLIVGDELKTLVFKTNAHPTIPNRFMRVVFEGTNFEIVQDYQVRLSQRKKQTYAKKDILKAFIKSPKYYLVQNNKAQYVKLKKRHLLSLFKEKKSTMKKFAKKNHMKLNSENDLISLLGYYESLTQPTATLASSGE